MTDLASPCGVLLVDKPAGPTSHDVVERVRRELGTHRVGHTGTLDPLATGLLLLCVGPATRLVEFLTKLPKRYLAGVRLGESTTTDDPEGEVSATSEGWRALERARVEDALASFRGNFLQTPPRFSAKKVAGRPAHYRTRRGEVVALTPIPVEVHGLELAGWNPPALQLDVLCSAGTYVRALARDLGEALGTGAHLRTLRRIEVGPFRVREALELEQLRDQGAVARAWLSPASALGHLPRVAVSPDEATRLAHGQLVPLPERNAALPDGPLAVVQGQELVAIAERVGERLRPRKVFAPARPQR